MPRTRLWIRAAIWLGNFHRRMLGVYFALLGPRAAYRVTEVLARLLYRLLTPFRVRSEAQCRAALGDRVPADEVPRIAEQSFVHRVWNLTDLLLAERFLHPGTYRRFGGEIPEPGRQELLAAQERKQPALLVSGYYGSFDLLPIFLGYNGLRVAAVYLPHANAAFDAHRRRIRQRGGSELVPVERAAERLSRVLAAGGMVALIVDHHESRRGIPVEFLGLPTQITRSLGLLAWRYDADVIVAGIRRVKNEFQFAFELLDVIKHAEWANQPDPVLFITNRYIRALEQLVRRDPTQYLWGYARWGEQLADALAAGVEPSAESASAGRVGDPAGQRQ